MKTILFLLLPFLASAQFTRVAQEKEMRRRAVVFDKYEPSPELARAVLPGMMGLMAGAMRTDTQRGRIVQQGLFFGGIVTVGAWGKAKPKTVLIRFASFAAGTAIGCILKAKEN